MPNDAKSKKVGAGLTHNQSSSVGPPTLDLSMGMPVFNCVHCHQSFAIHEGHVSEEIAICYPCLDRG